MKASVLLDEAVSLPVEERVYLVDCLLQTLNPPDASHVAAWAAVARSTDGIGRTKVVGLDRRKE